MYSIIKWKKSLFLNVNWRRRRFDLSFFVYNDHIPSNSYNECHKVSSLHNKILNTLKLSFFFRFRNSFMSLFSVQQLNPQLHRDSINIIDQLRNTLSSAASSSTSTNNDENNSRRRGENSQISCPICLSNSVLPVETNCGHIFCGNISLLLIFI